MPETTTFEKTVIICSLLIGFFGAVILVFFEMPQIIPSIFLATGISTLVYYFLGGIQDARFDMGPIKLTGSIAALIASAWFIDSKLEDQTYAPERTLSLNNNQEIITSNGKILGKITLRESEFKLGEELKVILNDSIELGRLNLGTLRLSKNFDVVSDKVKIGSLEADEFRNLGLFNNSNLVSYSEIKFNLRMNPFGAIVNEDFWKEPNRELKNSYNQLPFKLKPAYKNESDRTMVTYEDSNLDYELERGTVFQLEVPSKKESIYYVRVRNLTRNLDGVSFKNFVIYQIFEINKELSN